MTQKRSLFLYTLCFVLLACITNVQAQSHILSDASYRDQVYKDFQQRMSAAPWHQANGIQKMKPSDRKDALAFLYAYMPQSDLVDYSLDFFKQQVDIALEARSTFQWGKKVPDDIFRHFVLVHRVNNEDLDTARAYIFHQLRDRVRGLSMYDAALEVNHWCHEYVDYQPADVRTSAPLATLCTSHGRCGEESTLTVTALRAVGIPARQCYTPRWAHCDDNHAWVEAWIDGKWYFLGACEPDPELNMGWFAVPSSRTMMVHTNVFGKYLGPEEVNKQTYYYSCINVLPNYADTVHLTITVTGKNGKPVADATVLFKLYNYAEYYTLASRKTDARGRASLVTGKGDLLIWVKKDGVFNYAKVDCRKQNRLTVPLVSPTAGIVELEMNPPVGGATLTQATPERTAVNDRRKLYEDSLREAYRHSFPTPLSLAAEGIHNPYFTDEELQDIVRRSEGNYQEIINFLNLHPEKKENILLKEYIASLADKDLRDTKASVLESNLIAYDADKFPKDVFIKGLLSVRISNELLRNRNPFLRKATALGDKPTVDELRQYTLDNIVLDPDCNYFNCPISPDGVLLGKRADAHSLGIFFVALCRSYGRPAYMDNSNGELYAWERGNWRNIPLTADPGGAKAQVPMSTIVLHNPNGYGYYTQYTLQRLEDGEYVSYDFENDPRVDKPHIELNVPAGKYCLSTGSRYSNGDVLSRMEFFETEAGKTTDKTIVLRPLQAKEGNYGHIDVDQNYVNGKSLQQWMSQAGTDVLVLCLVVPGTEPVNHLMKEMAAKQKEYEQWNGPVLLVTDRATWKAEPQQPKNCTVTTDNYEKLRTIILNGLMERRQGENPVCIVVDRNGTILLFSEGYHIGLGEMLLDIQNSKSKIQN